MNEMISKAFSYAVIVLLLFGLGTGLADERTDKFGLLLVGHGSRSEAWTKATLDVGVEVCYRALQTGKFVAGRTAFMEHSDPCVPEAAAQLESAGCTHIVAVPLFVMPADHTLFDLPAVLGLYLPSAAHEHEHEHEHAGISRVSIPITLTPTMSEDRRLLPQYALDQVLKMSKSPSEEAIVVLAHGSPAYQVSCDQVMRRVVAYCCGKSGIDYADWAYVGVGQGFETDGLPAIQKAAACKDRVLVVGLYLSLSAQGLHDRAIAESGTAHTAQEHHRHGGDALRGKEIVFSTEGIVAHPGLIDWAVESAVTAADRLQQTHPHHDH